MGTKAQKKRRQKNYTVVHLTPEQREDWLFAERTKLWTNWDDREPLPDYTYTYVNQKTYDRLTALLKKEDGKDADLPVPVP